MIINVTMSSLIVELPAVCHFNILNNINSDVSKSVKCVYFLFVNPYVCIYIYILQIVLTNVTIL